MHCQVWTRFAHPVMKSTIFCPECSDTHSRDEPACPIVNGQLHDSPMKHSCQAELLLFEAIRAEQESRSATRLDPPPT